MADQDDEWANHVGGFKRPPPWGRFKKGQSGNPKGRPKTKVKTSGNPQNLRKNLTESEAILDRISEEQVEVSRGGAKIRLSKKEALRHAQYNLAIKGNGLAMRDLSRDILRVEGKKEALRIAEAEVADQEARQKARRDEAWFQHLVALKNTQATAWANARGRGEAEPEVPWPHPDDVLIDYVNRMARIRGPIGPDDLDDWAFLRRSRDHHLARVVYHAFLEGNVHRLISKMWLVGMVESDLNLPKRWQISQNMRPASDRLMAMGFEKLEALVEEGASVFEAGSQRLSGDAYRQANRKWAPLIKMLGFRSIRHMERYGEEAEKCHEFGASAFTDRS